MTKMPTSYLLGILFAMLAGAMNAVGAILQKSATNRIIIRVQKGSFTASFVRDLIWISGLAVSIGLGTVFNFVAQSRIGLALVPALTASGMIILAIGSASLLNEKLKPAEWLGIFSLINGAKLAVGDLDEYLADPSITTYHARARSISSRLTVVVPDVPGYGYRTLWIRPRTVEAKPPKQLTPLFRALLPLGSLPFVQRLATRSRRARPPYKIEVERPVGIPTYDETWIEQPRPEAPQRAFNG